MSSDGDLESNTIALIYDNEERSVADHVAVPLIAAGYDVVLAPIGLQTGSEVWKARVRHDLLSAGAVLFLLTEKAVMDGSCFRSVLSLGSMPW